MREPLHLLVELVRAEDATAQHGAKAGDTQVYLMRDPDDTGRYAEGSFRWTRAVQRDLAALAQVRELEDAAARLAALVRRFLEGTPWDRYAPLVDAALADGRDAVITIRSAAAELYALPWEWLPLAGGPAVRTPGCVVRYDWPDDELRADRFLHRDDDALARTEPQAPGRIVIAWSAAAGSVPAAEHRRAIASAAREGRVAFDLSADVVAGTTREMLRAALERGRDVAVLHLLCHGVPLPGDDGFGLAFSDEDGDVDVLAPSEIAELLEPFAATLKLVVVQACHGGNTGGLECHAGSVAQAIHRAGIPVVLSSRYPLSVQGSIRITEHLYRSLLVELASIESAMLTARQDELAAVGSFDWAALQLYADPEVGVDNRPIAFRPFRGLLPFESRHARFFFGRNAEVAALVERVGALVRCGGRRFLLVAGASGSGKSSLVHAGVLPALARGVCKDLPHDPEDAVLFRPGEQPERPVALLRERLVRARRAGPDRLVILVVDQLEELYTEVEEPERTVLMRALWALADPAEACVVLATVRLEYIGRFGELPMDTEGRKFDAVSLDERFRYFVRQLEPAQVDAIICGPARAVGLRFEEGLIARLRADVGKEPGALPLLSYTLDLLWQHRRARWLKGQTYDALGRLVGALTKTADELYASLAEPTRQLQARNLLVQLVHMGDDPATATRRRGQIERLRPADAATAAQFDAAVVALVDARLLVRGSTSDDPADIEHAWVEVAHEALIRGWTRLQTWLHESRDWLAYADELRGYAEAWSPHRGEPREPDYLIAGTRLAYARELWSRHHTHLGGGDQRLLGAFVERCVEHERRRIRSQRLIVAAVFTAISLAAVVAVYQAIQAGISRNDAEEQARVANEQTAIAEEKTLVAEEQTRLAEEQTRLAEEQTRLAKRKARQARNTLKLSAAQELRERDPIMAALFLVHLEDEASEPIFGFQALAVDVSGSLGASTTVFPVGDTIVFATPSTDGRRVMAASEDGTARVWSASTGAPLSPSWRFEDRVKSAVFSADGARIVTTTWEDVVQVWSVSEGAPAGPALRHASQLADATFLGERVLTISRDGTTRLWEGSEAEPFGPKLGDDEVVRATFTEDGARVVTAELGWMSEARLWRMSTAEPLGRPLENGWGIRDAVFSRDGERLVTLSDSDARLWSGTTGKRQEPPLEAGGRFRSAAFSMDGARIVTASENGYASSHGFQSSGGGLAQIWSASTGEQLGLDLVHGAPVLSAALLEDEGVVTVSTDGTMRLWSDRAGTSRARPMTHEIRSLSGLREVLGAVFSADGERVLTASGNSEASLWSPRTGELLGSHIDSQGRGRVVSAIFSPDRARILTASEGGPARLWHEATGAPIGAPMAHAGADDAWGSTARSALFSADGERVVTTSGDRTARLWSGRTGAPLGAPMRHAETVHSAAFSGDGERVVTASGDGTARLWSARTGAPLPIVMRHEDPVLSAVFSADGGRLLTVSEDATARLWNGTTGESLGVPMEHEGVVVRATFSGDGARVVTASEDGTARLWSGQTGEPLGAPMNHGGPVLSASFSADGTRVVTSSQDGTARVWSGRTGEPLSAPMKHDGPVLSASFSADGAQVVTACQDGSARLWSAETGMTLMDPIWHRWLRDRVRGCLPAGYRREYLGETTDEANDAVAECMAELADGQADERVNADRHEEGEGP